MTKPNVIFIVSDQHRGDWMGCAGSRIVHTPNLDRMALEGVMFERAYCNAPLCVPSRMSMLTGRYPHQTDVFTNADHLRSDLPTFAHAMGLGGYETVLCGRMHFVGPDQRHGYQKRLVGDITHCYLGGPQTDYGALAGTAGQGLASIMKAGPGDSPVLRYDEDVVAACEQFLKTRSAETEAPLFMTVGFYGPHHPYVCPQAEFERAWEAMHASGDEPLPGDDKAIHPWYADWAKRLKSDQITDKQLQVARASYAGLISLTDTYVGRIMQAAEALKGETIIVYVSDHGDMAGDRRMFWKRNMLEGAVRVPMIWWSLKQADSIAQGKKVRAPVSLVDMAPTFAAIGGAPRLPMQAGEDLMPLLSGSELSSETTWEERAVYIELANKQDSVIRAVIQGGMKLIYFYGYEKTLLFDLNNDPQEQANLADSPDYKAIHQELLQAIRHDGWDAAKIDAQIVYQGQNQQYLAAWGAKVGMGRSDLWAQKNMIQE